MTSGARNISAHDHRYVRQVRRNRSSKRAGSSAWIAGQFAVEALGPGVERQRVVAAQVLDVDHLEPVALHRLDRLREARDPAAGEDVLADAELGVAHADVADEVDDAERAGLQRVGMRADDCVELVAARVLERADRQQLVVLARDLAEIALDDSQLVREPAALELRREARRPARCVVLMPVPIAP